MAPGGRLGPSWGLLGALLSRSWGVLGIFWSYLGIILGAYASSLQAFPRSPVQMLSEFFEAVCVSSGLHEHMFFARILAHIFRGVPVAFVFRLSKRRHVSADLD